MNSRLKPYRATLQTLQQRAKEATDWKNSKRMGFPTTKPHPLALEAYRLFLTANQNHIGTHTRQTREHNSSHALELELIKSLSSYYGDATADGYINSGCTEGNILALWIAREKINHKNYRLIKSSLTHQSIDKAIKLLNLANVTTIPVTNNFTIDFKLLNHEIKKQIAIGIKEFIICLTVGYTLTGTADDVQQICQLCSQYQKQYNASFFIHIDAAIGGLVYKFTTNQVFDFNLPEVNTIVLDFHKMGLVPYSAGVFLCRQHLQESISQYISYTGSHQDDTLIGSRGGAPAAACWAVWDALHPSKYSEIFQSCISNKHYFINKLSRFNKKVKIYNYSPINIFALEFPTLRDKRLPQKIEHKYRIVLSPFKRSPQDKIKKIYKIYIMPHLTKKAINEFIADLTTTL